MEQDIWRLQQECTDIRAVQAEYADRLARLEQRQDEDYRMKSLWKSPSPFPALLSSAVSLANSNQYIEEESLLMVHGEALVDRTQADADVDDLGLLTQEQETQFLSSLAIDEAEVPRRGASRANSVRFDDYIQNHWINDSSKSAGGSDYFPSSSRSVSQLENHTLDERPSIYKSDDRHSVTFSPALGVSHFTTYNTLSKTENTSPIPQMLQQHQPGNSSSPSLIHCALNPQDDKDRLAAICSGSSTSVIERYILHQLALDDRISDDNGRAYVRLRVYLLDHSHRESSNAVLPPYITVNFTVIDSINVDTADMNVSIFIGSDVMTAYQADILFSHKQLVLYVDDGRKVSLPFYRPGPKHQFADLFTLHFDLVTRQINQKGASSELTSGQDITEEDNEKTDFTLPTNNRMSRQYPPGLSIHSRNGSGHSFQNLMHNRSENSTNESGRLEDPIGSEMQSANAAAIAQQTPEPPDQKNSKVDVPTWHADQSIASQQASSDSDTPRYQSVSATLPSKRGMKVLRPSRASSVSDINNNNNNNNNNSSSIQQRKESHPTESRSRNTSQPSSLSNPYKSIKFVNKLDIKEAKRLNPNSNEFMPRSVKSTSETAVSPQSEAPRKKSVNPLGGATAFAWMNGKGPVT